MNSRVNRRKFIIDSSLKVGGALTLATGLSACATLDDYLFEDRYELKDQSLIIGGGLSGLSSAYFLKKKQNEYLVTESSPSFGGRIKSYQHYDLGGSIFSKKGTHLNKMIKELKLETTEVDPLNSSFTYGAEQLISTLAERLGSLMPYRQVRLRWKLQSIKPHRNGYECVFLQPRGIKTLLAEKVILAIPPTQWPSIGGLMELPEMQPVVEWMNSIALENVVRVNFPLPKDFRLARNKAIQKYQEDKVSIRQVYRSSKQGSWFEFDFAMNRNEPTLEIQKLNDILRRRTSLAAQKIGSEHYFDWRSVSSIQSAYFLNSLAFPRIESPQFQVVGDFAAVDFPNSMEGAVESAFRATERFV